MQLSREITPNNHGAYLDIVQITDMHLFADKARCLQGYATYHNLSDTIDYLLAKQKMPNFVLVTGDISQDETSESYQFAREQLERLKLPVYWIHGNHDDEPTVKSIFKSSPYLRQLNHVMTPYWDFIALNTCRRGTDDGYLEESELMHFWQKVSIAKSRRTKIVVVMHHHPYPVGTPLVDACMLKQAEKFLAQVKQHAEIKLLICGHVHGDYQIASGGQMIEAGPATSFQWQKGTHTLETDSKRGFKYFTFHTDAYQVSTTFF